MNNEYLRHYFSHKLIVITGGSSGLGLELALSICQYGGQVVIIGRDRKKLDAAVLKISQVASSDAIKAFQVDVSHADQLVEVFKSISELYGMIHGVIINAGQIYTSDFRLIPIQKIQDVLNTNINGAIYTARVALPYLSEDSFLAFTASLAAFVVAPESSLYTTSKRALVEFSRILRIELLPRGIRVLTFIPGFFDTDFIKGGSATPFLQPVDRVVTRYLDAIAKKKKEVIFPKSLFCLISIWRVIWKMILILGLDSYLAIIATHKLHRFYGNGILDRDPHKETRIQDTFGFRHVIVLLSPTKAISDWLHDVLKIKRN